MEGGGNLNGSYSYGTSASRLYKRGLGSPNLDGQLLVLGSGDPLVESRAGGHRTIRALIGTGFKRSPLAARAGWEET